MSAAVAALLAGCAGGTTDPGRAGVAMTGSWGYAATSSAVADVRGSFVVNQQQGARVGGTFDVVETAADGTARRLAGALAGTTSDSTAVDFEAQLGGGVRRHVGRVRGDSLTGAWVETPTGGGVPTATGTFRAARQR